MKCKTCKKAIFIAKFGVYSCSKLTCPRDGDCDFYEKGTPQESKDNEAYYKDMDYKEGED